MNHGKPNGYDRHKNGVNKKGRCALNIKGIYTYTFDRQNKTQQNKNFVAFYAVSCYNTIAGRVLLWI